MSGFIFEIFSLSMKVVFYSSTRANLQGMKPLLDNGQVNPDYADFIGHTLKEILHFQQSDYKLSSYSDIEAIFVKLPFIDDETLYKLSVQCRPPSSDASSTSSFDSVQ
jgi:hypothetical protein